MALKEFLKASDFINYVENRHSYSRPLDTGSYNIVLGCAYDSTVLYGEAADGVWLLFEGEGFSVTIVTANFETYFLGAPSNTSSFKPPSLAFKILAGAIKARDLPKIRSVYGPHLLVEGLMEVWSTMVEPPLQIRKDPFMRTHLAFITAAELPPATTTQSRSMPEDYHIVDLVIWAKENVNTFILDSVVKDQARAIMEFFGAVNEDTSIGLKAVNDVLSKELTGSYFVCLHVPSLEALTVVDSDELSPSFVAAYVFTGRATPSTIAIRNVYTREPHRRRGLAGALVNAATTYWLKGVEGRRKTEVVLFVEPGSPAERVYRKCGFTITDVAYEQRGWEGVEKGAF